MKQVDNLSMEEFTLSTSSINENISLKSNNKSNSNSYPEHEEIETRSCPQRTCGPMGQVLCVVVFLIYVFYH